MSPRAGRAATGAAAGVCHSRACKHRTFLHLFYSADAQRSWVALLEKGLPFEIRKVGPASQQGAAAWATAVAAAAHPRALVLGAANPVHLLPASQVDLNNKDAEFVETYHSIYPDPEAPAKVRAGGRCRLPRWRLCRGPCLKGVAEAVHSRQMVFIPGLGGTRPWLVWQSWLGRSPPRCLRLHARLPPMPRMLMLMHPALPCARCPS